MPRLRRADCSGPGFQRVKRGGSHAEQHVDAMLANGGGLFTRLFRRLFGMIGKSWHMYPLGVLFGQLDEARCPAGHAPPPVIMMPRAEFWRVSVGPSLY